MLLCRCRGGLLPATPPHPHVPRWGSPPLCVVSHWVRGASWGREAGGLGVLSPISRPPLTLFRAQTSGSSKRSGSGSGGGSGGTLTYVPLHCPPTQGKGVVQNCHPGCFAAPFPRHLQVNGLSGLGALTFEPRFKTPPSPSGGSPPPPPPPPPPSPPLARPSGVEGGGGTRG